MESFSSIGLLLLILVTKLDEMTALFQSPENGCDRKPREQAHGENEAEYGLFYVPLSS